MQTSRGAAWDMSSFFPAFDGPEMRGFIKKLTADIASLQAESAGLGSLSKRTLKPWEKVVLAREDINARLEHLTLYVNCMDAADAGNEAIAKQKAALSALSAESDKLDVELLRAFKGVPQDCFAAFIRREPMAPVAYYLRRLRERSRKTMEPELERLAADLNVDGFHAWGRLYDRASSRLEFDMVYPDGRKERTPVSKWRSLMGSPDRAIGRAAFEGGNRAWASVEDVCAAALNAISGTRLTLSKRRGLDHFLDAALFQAGMSRKSLDAMYEAIRANLDIPRGMCRAKAAKLGRTGICWFEREAPLPLGESSSAELSWEQGVAMVSRSFRTVYPGLADYYRGFLDKRWLESEPRGRKRPGAFCEASSLNDEERVFMTFNGALHDVSTMAHEMGHAWHGHLMHGMRPMARRYPMTLAETASIFAEQLLAEGVYADPGVSETDKLLMLDSELSGAAVLLLDITTRFEFEKSFHEERASGELPVSRFKELMTESQRRVMGDALEPGGEDPMFWASKLHFYLTDVSFYNFPYTVGFLLARALFIMFREQGSSFLPRYEEFLRLTGSDTVEEVAAKTLGADVASPEFWAEPIRSLKEPLEKYRGLLKAR
ncbi:MAG: M3 family oligoendopeptidase [Elusimicrobiota bacterium]